MHQNRLLALAARLLKQPGFKRPAAAIAALLLVFSAPSYAADPIKILALGDSLTAGYGLNNPADAFPAQLEKALKAKGHNISVIQGGISGDTTTGGRSRLEWSLAAKPDAVILELGANDALRAIDPKLTNDNLAFMVKRISDAGIPVLLAGMMAPPNLGRDYSDRFNKIYPAIAKDMGVLLYPFFLDGVAAIPELNQGDRIHPTEKGVKVIVERILPVAEKLVAQAEAARAKR
ncbi:MAG: arylesterase [Rhodospirillaceae bacterium]|nr:arylesterase [Rhodospirillaceae bacterium]